MGNTIACKYLKEVKRNLPYFMTGKKTFLKDFQDNLDTFSDENPDAAWEEFTDRFGTPEEIAVSFLPETESKGSLKKTRRKKLAVRLVIAFFAVLLAILVVLTAFYVQDKHYFYHGYSTKTVYNGSVPDYSDALAVY